MAKKSTHRLAVFGVQGSGKGTQAELLASACGFVYLSTGDTFRREIGLGTELGAQVQATIDAGNLAPDDLTNEIVAKRLAESDCHESGFVLDGYPRNAAQQTFLDGIVQLTGVIEIKISDDEAVRRLGGRRACRCGLSYHVEARPPKVEGTCDTCGEALYVRDDDQPEAIRKRMQIYHAETEPLLAAYRERGLLHTVDGEQPIEQVFEQIVAALQLDCPYPGK